MGFTLTMDVVGSFFIIIFEPDNTKGEGRRKWTVKDYDLDISYKIIKV